MSLLKRIAARLPRRLQFELESFLRARQVRTGDFSPEEPEYELLPHLLHAGDWALDVGANIGHYTLELARLVGPGGRVVAVEPMLWPLAQLAGLLARLGIENVTLIHAAASDRTGLMSMDVPRSSDGLPSYYDARVQETGDKAVLCIRVDNLVLPGRVALVKVDAEGHEIQALQGMENLIRRCRPVLIVENPSPEILEFLANLGYLEEKLTASPNRIFWPMPPDNMERSAEADAEGLAMADS